jgi:hypothetical protein
MKALRRPILSPSQPKNIPPGIDATPEANSPRAPARVMSTGAQNQQEPISSSHRLLALICRRKPCLSQVSVRFCILSAARNVRFKSWR